ncbi:SSI family serine proteinase inhibitor [Kitasatospora sp. NPDC001175]|uniref:SSI family serine proteinase inhibitor n=1 Tax=Kitasatospora sp. NPDC001175 TaxID=3157103 RepID=UPI003D00207C
MTTTGLRRLAASAAAALVAVTTLSVSPAPAVPAAESSFFQLYVVRDADDTAVEDYFLTCKPDGGSHLAPERACAALTIAEGDINRLAGDRHRTCPDVQDPVTATAYGDWNGQQVTWQKTFTSLCRLQRATSPLY